MKKRCVIPALLLFLLSLNGLAQGKFYTKTGKISFFSSAPLEDIEAVNKSVTALLDTKSGDLQFAVLMKGFEFKKALMQEHFNKNYVESDKYPRSEFKGQVVNNNAVNYNTNGVYNVSVKGKLSIHGVTKDVESTGTLTVKDGRIIAHAIFAILLADYKITIPKLHRDNISKNIRITVDCNLEPLQ